jgi:hypothetical protein
MMKSIQQDSATPGALERALQKLRHYGLRDFDLT